MHTGFKTPQNQQLAHEMPDLKIEQKGQSSQPQAGDNMKPNSRCQASMFIMRPLVDSWCSYQYYPYGGQQRHLPTAVLPELGSSLEDELEQKLEPDHKNNRP